MYLLNKNEKININKIHIKYNKIYNIYNLYYTTNYIKCNGICITIKFKTYIKIGYLYYIIIDDDNILKLLFNIESYIQKYIKFFNIIHYKNNDKYIICNNINNKNLKNIKEINIYLKNIKYINYNYIPKINII